MGNTVQVYSMGNTMYRPIACNTMYRSVVWVTLCTGIYYGYKSKAWVAPLLLINTTMLIIAEANESLCEVKGGRQDDIKLNCSIHTANLSTISWVASWLAHQTMTPVIMSSNLGGT